MKIERIFHFEKESEPNYFHPAISPIPEGLLMTLQTFNGAGDTYGPPLYAISTDDCASWTQAEVIPPLDMVELAEDVYEGVADIRPFYHEKTNTTIVIGCTTSYGPKKLIEMDKDLHPEKYYQKPVYAIRDSSGNYSERQNFFHPFFKDNKNWRIACPQIAILENGDVILPIYYADPSEDREYSCCTMLCSFDGKTLKEKKVGAAVEVEAKYAVEPSIVRFKDKFYMTIRATDDHGYMATSNDGINWDKATPWKWDDSEDILLKSTQQHWMLLDDKIYLVYTRPTEDNADVRWSRAPLFFAEFAPSKKCLIKSTEEIAVPVMRKDGTAYLMGNFHVANISKERAIISDAPIWFEITKEAFVEDDYISAYNNKVSIVKVKL